MHAVTDTIGISQPANGQKGHNTDPDQKPSTDFVPPQLGKDPAAHQQDTIKIQKPQSIQFRLERKAESHNYRS